MKNQHPLFLATLFFAFSFHVLNAQEDCSSYPDFDALISLYNATDGLNWQNKEGWEQGANGLDCNYCDWPTVGCDDENRVTHLYLDNNNLSYNIPPEFSNLDKLIELRIGENDFTGPIDPIIFSIPSLENISIYDNDMTGQIPEAIGNLSNLKRFVCDRNNLEGPLPASLINCVSMETFSMATNQFEGSFPEVLLQLSSIKTISINNNNIAGPIAGNFSNVPELRTFRADNNSLSGSLPDLSQNPLLEILFLEGNEFAGEIPMHYGDFQNMRNLNLSTNNLNGCIPQSFGNYCGEDISVRMIENEGLSHNSNFNSICNGNECDLNDPCFNGNRDNNESGVDCGGSCKPCIEELPICTDFPDYIAMMEFYDSTNGRDWTNHVGWNDGRQGLSCNYCDWEGVLCDENNRVREINFNINHLTGTIPSSINELSFLENLFIPRNFISGNIPSELGFLENLQILDLKNNELSGSIPSSLGDIESLIELYLNENNLSGSLPSELGNLSNLQVLYVHLNELEGELPVSLSEISGFLRLYLFSNNFTGPIPEQYGYWNNMEFFFLSDNNLSGCIPESFTNYCNDTSWGVEMNPELSHGGDADLFCQNSECVYTSIYDLDRQLLNLYPNPASETLTLDPSAEGTFRLKIINNQGITIMDKDCNSLQSLNISQFPPGMYYAVVQSKYGIQSIPFIKI